MKDVWYKFTASASASYNIIVSPSPNFDAVVSLYSSCSGADIKCADSMNVGGMEIISTGPLSAGTYYIRVYDYGITDPSTTTFNICITTSCTLPSVPVLNTPTVASSSQINLNWNAANGAQSYDVYYDAGNCPGAASTFFANTNLTNLPVTVLTQSTTYRFKVVAKNTCGYSSASNCQNATTNPSTVCTDNYEPNDVQANAYNLFSTPLSSTPDSKNINSFIYSGTDQDYYKINVNSGSYGTVTVNLSSLPADYNAELFDNSLSLITWSNNLGTTPENLSYNYTNVSSYQPPFYVLVFPSNNTQYNQCDDYLLNVSWTPAGSCSIPPTPTPVYGGSATCPGAGFVSASTAFQMGWTNSGSGVYYDYYIYEYPYNLNNVLDSGKCISGISTNVSSQSIIPGKLYCWRVRSTANCNNCNSPLSQPFYFHFQPPVFPNGSIVICNQPSTTLSTPAITVPSPCTVSYQWYKNSIPIVGANSPGYTATTSGSYYVILTYSGSTICSGNVSTIQSNNVSVSISNSPAPPTLNSNSPICEGSMLTLSANVIGGASYFWTGTASFASNNTSIYIPNASVQNAGTYYCYIMVNGCQSNVASINTIINPVAASGFSYTISGNNVTFTNTSLNATSYSWNFGDSNTSTALNPSHTYSVNGNYPVCLVATDTGCTAPSTYCALIQIGIPNGGGATLASFAKVYRESSLTKNYFIKDVIQSPADSGFICIGDIQDQVSPYNSWVIYFKVDKNGNVVWAKELQQSPPTPSAYSIIKSNNGYLFSFTYPSSNCIMEIDESGNKLWANKYSSTVGADLGLIFPIQSGGFLWLGSDNYGSNKVINKLDISGNIIWTKAFANLGGTLTNVFQTSDGGFILGGTINNPLDFLLFKIDANGNQQWTKTYGGSDDDVLGTIIQTSSGYYIAGGGTQSFGVSPYQDDLILKLDNSGNLIASDTLNTRSSYSPINYIEEKQNGNFILKNWRVVFETDGNFNCINSKFLKHGHFNPSTKKTFDNALIMPNRFDRVGAPTRYSFSLYKSSFNDTSCVDSTITITSSTVSPTVTTLTPTIASSTITATTFPNNPNNVTLIDSSLCFTCNLTASITSSGSTTFCLGSSVTLTANNGMTNYLWSNGNTAQSITVNSNGNIAVAITDSSGCGATSQNVTVTVNPLPYANAGADQSLCLGNSVGIGPSTISGNTYSWSPSTGLNSTNTANPSANPTTTTTYTLTITDSLGCSSKDQIIVTVINCVGINEVKNEVSLQIYPNPTSGIFTIQSSEKNYTIEIINLLGEKIYSSTINSNKSEIDLSKQPQGIYFIKMNSVKGTSIKKLIKE